METIEKFEDLLWDFLDEDKDHVDIETKRLSAPGENYGSVIVAIKITIQNENEEEIVHNLIAKLVPPNDFLKKFMNTSYTFRNEFGFYKTIAPCLRNFQKEQGSTGNLDFIPKFYGGRLSLVPTSPYADDDAVILLENLKEQGFVLSDREMGFDLPTAKLILLKLAELHGAALAFKTLRPEAFEKHFAPYFEEFKVLDSEENPVNLQNSTNLILNMVEDDEVCRLHVYDIKEAVENGYNRLRLPRNNLVVRKGTFTTLIHGDVWINNLLVKKHNGKITDVKFIDFQLYEYHSITKDVLFFIFTSVQSSVLRNHVDDLINFYFTSLLEQLKQLQCDLEKFLFKDFMKEMKETAKQQEYFHIMMILRVIYADEDNVWDSEKIDKDKFSKQLQVFNEAKKRGALITREFIQRGWI